MGAGKDGAARPGFRILELGEAILPTDFAMPKSAAAAHSDHGPYPTILGTGHKVEAWDHNFYYRPLPDAAGVPEAKPKGPSLPEVTQPGEGVDLEDAEKWFLGLQPMAKTSRTGLALIAEVRSLRSSNEALSTLVNDLDALIKESEGVAGLHLNGDLAPWHDLTAGGRYESWLRSLEDARATLRRESK
jgi:hypothetical protein